VTYCNVVKLLYICPPYFRRREHCLV